MLSDIPKNLHRSLLQHIETNFTTTPIYWEGQSQREPLTTYPFIEVRMDGPHMKPLEKGEIYCEFEANILIHGSVLGNMYAMDEIGGELIDILWQNIDIADGAGTALGCALPLTDRRKFIEFNQFGIIDPNSELMQSTIEIRYSVTLET